MSMSLMAPLPLRRASPRAAAECVRALVQCWSSRWPHSRNVPCRSTPTPRCSVTPPSVSTTRLPRCLDQRVSILQMSRASFSCNRLRHHRRVHRSSRCSLRSAAGTPHTAHGVVSKYRPIRVRRVRSARVAFPTARLHSLQANAMSCRSAADMPVWMKRYCRLAARQAPVPRDHVVYWAWRLPGSSVDAPPGV